MATKTMERNARIQKMWDLLIDVWERITASAYDCGVTVAAWAAAESIYVTYWPAHFTWATFTTTSIYLVLLLIRVVHKFDESYTLDEIGETLTNMDHELNEKIEEIQRNV